MIIGTCKRCKMQVKFDTGDLSYEKGFELIKNIQMFECPGMHVFIAGIYDHYEWENK